MEEKYCVNGELKKLRPRLRKDIIVGAIVMSLMRWLIRYGLMTLYIVAAQELGLFTYGLAVKVAACLTSWALSCWILTGVSHAVLHKHGLDWRNVGIIATIGEVVRVVKQYK